jgi:carboxyl-terminal processing protease
MALRDVVKKIRGKKGTEVRLTIIRDVGKNNKPERMIVPIIREEIKLQDSDAESELYLYKNMGKNIKIGYIKLPSFYMDYQSGKSSSGDTRLHIKKMVKQNAEILMLDLRGNPGGGLKEAINIARLFIDEEKGPILQVKAADSPAQDVSESDESTIYRGPVVVLIDKFSASASEIIAGAIKDYGRGLVLGPRSTFGKGTVQNLIGLPNELGAIKITTHLFYQPSGTSNQLYGIKPDIIIPSLTSIWDIGEQKTRYPLKWKKIKSANFKKFKLVNNNLLSILKNKSSNRISRDRDFIELSKKIKKFRKLLNNKTISLKEESKLEKQKEDVMKKGMHRKKGKVLIDLKEDLFLKEAFNITGDYYKMVK